LVVEKLWRERGKDLVRPRAQGMSKRGRRRRGRRRDE